MGEIQASGVIPSGRMRRDEGPVEGVEVGEVGVHRPLASGGASRDPIVEHVVSLQHADIY